MNKVFVFFIIILFSGFVKGQSFVFSFTDVVSGTGNKIKTRVNYSSYIPNSSTPIKYIRVNFHFMLKSNHSGNFTETTDGINSNNAFTAYYFAKKTVDLANDRLNDNHKSNLPPNNSIPVLPTKYRFMVDGIYFHEDDNNYYYGSSSAVSLYSINKDEVINVFMEGKNNATGYAHANLGTTQSYIEFNGAWDDYKSYVLNPPYTGVLDDFMWVNALTLCHEAGHNMDLSHTMWDCCSGTCNLNAEDYCADTPTGQEMITIYGAPQMCCTKPDGSYKACCGWNEMSTYCSNNMMDYSGHMAITPDQLARIHYALSTYMVNHNVCRTLINDLNVYSFSDTQILFSGNNLVIPASSISGTNMILKSGQSKTFIYNNSITLNPGFEVQQGGELTIEQMDQCQSYSTNELPIIK